MDSIVTKIRSSLKPLITLCALLLMLACNEAGKLGFISGEKPAILSFNGAKALQATTDGKYVLVWDFPSGAQEVSALNFEVHMDKWSSIPQGLKTSASGSVGPTEGDFVGTQTAHLSDDLSPVGKGVLLNTVKGARSYTLTEAIQPNVIYAFQVRLLDSGGTTDRNDLVLIYTPSANTLSFGGASGLAPNSDNGKLILTWQPPQVSTGADPATISYDVYMSMTTESPDKIIASGTLAIPTPTIALTEAAPTGRSSKVGTLIDLSDDKLPSRSGAPIAQVKGSSLYQVSHELSSNLTYIFQVQANGPAGQKGVSRRVIVYQPSKLQFNGLQAASVTLSEDKSTFNLKWTPASRATGSVSYVIFGDANFTNVISTTSDTTYAFQGVKRGQSYVFAVRAKDATGYDSNIQFVQAEIPAFTFDGIKQSGAVLSTDLSSITLTWDPATNGQGPVSYTIFNDVNFSNIVGTTSKTTYTVKNIIPGQTYTFAVTARDSGGSVTNKSFAVVTVQLPSFNGCTSSQALSSKTSAAIYYDFPSTASSVTIYRGSTNVYTALSSGTNFFTDSGLIPGATYTYLCVASFNGKTINGATTTVTMLGNSTPPVFSGLASAKPMTNSKISLAWTASTTSDLQQYNIYLSSSLNTRIGSTTDSNYVVTGLTTGANYSFVVRAMNTSGYEDNNSIQKSAATLSYSVPDFAGISGITPASGVAGLSSLILSWIPAGGNVTGYRIYMSSTTGGEDYTSPVATVTGITNSGATATLAGPYLAGQYLTGATVTGLTLNSTYYFAVRAFYLDGSNNILSDVNQLELSGKTNSIVAPTFAGVASAVQGSGILALSTATLSWAAPQSNGVWDGFQIAYEEGTCTAGFSSSPTTALVSGASIRSFTVTGLTGNRTYRFRVRSNYAAYSVTDTNVTCVQATTTATAPNFAGVSEVTDASGIAGFTQLNVNWSQATGSFSYYLVEYAANSNFTSPTSISNISQIATTSAAITGLTPNTQYYVRVSAVFNGVSPNLTAGTSVVMTASTTPSAPAGEGITTTTVLSPTSVGISWSAPTNGGLYSGYKLWRSCSATAAIDIQTAPSYSSAYQTFANTTTLTYTDTGMTSNTQCCYQVRAYYSDGTNTLTSQSNTLSQCVTPTLVAPAFAGVSSVAAPVASTGFNQLTVNWTPIATSDDGNFSCYQISVSTTTTGLNWPADCASVDASLRSSTTSSYSATGLSANSSYYVRVRAVNANGTPIVSRGDNAVLSAATTPKAPTGDTLSNADVDGFSSVNVTYTPPSTTASVGGLFNNVFLYVYQGTPTQLSAFQQNIVAPANIGSPTFAATMGSGVVSLGSAPTSGALARLPLAALTSGQANTFKISGLTTGQSVCVMLQAVYWVSGSPTQFLASNINTTKCATPTAIAPTFAGVGSIATPISSIGFARLNASWTALTNATDLTNFSYYEVNWATSPTPTTWNSVQISSAETNTYGITGLAANTTYYVRVQAVNNQGTVAVANGSNNVLQGTTTPMAPTGDSLTAAVSDSSTSIRLTYTAPSGTAATGGLYNNIFLWVYQGTSSSVASFQSSMGTPVIANVTSSLTNGSATLATPPTSGTLIQVAQAAFTAGATNTFTINGLNANQAVCVRALAVNWVNGQPSQYLVSQTPSTQCTTPTEGPPVFAGLTSLTGYSDNRDFTKIIANWSAPTGQCTSIDVSASTAQASPDFTTATFAAAKGLACSTTSYTITGLTPGQTYYVQVRANNSGCGNSASCSSGAGLESSKVTLPPTPTGDGITGVTFNAVSKSSSDSAALSWTLPAVGGYWNKMAIWRASGANTAAAAIAVKAAANAYSGTGGSQTNAPLTMIAQGSPASATAVSYTDGTLVDGTPYCYLARAVYDDGIAYNASVNQATQCGASAYEVVAFTGVSTSGSSVSSTWADGTAKVKLQFPAALSGDVEEFWVYYSPSSSLSTFDLTGAPWQIVDNTATSTYNPNYPSGSFIYVGGQGRTFSGTGYFIVRAVHYGLSGIDSNTAISNSVTIPTAQANYVYVSPSVSRLSYPYWIGAYEASLASGTLAADTVSSTETNLTTCSYQFHVNGVAKHSSCGSFASTGVAQSVTATTPATAKWHQAWTACRNATTVGSVGNTGASSVAGNAYVRLPTETEWRRASRWAPNNYANQWTTYQGGAGNCNSASGSLTATGSGSNCVGLVGAFDMAGNQREWVDQRLTMYDIALSFESRFSYGPQIGRILANGIDVQASAANSPVTRRYHNIIPGASGLGLLLGSDYASSGLTYEKQYDAETESWQDPTLDTATGTSARGFRCVAFPSSKYLPTMAMLGQASEPVYSSSDIPGSPTPTATQAAQWKIPENLYVKDARAESINHLVGMFPNTTSLAVWPLNGTVSGDQTDLTGQGRTLTASGTLGNGIGLDGKAYSNALSGVTLSSSDALFNQTGAFTLGGWFYSANWSGLSGDTSLMDYNGTTYNIWLASGGALNFGVNGTYYAPTGAPNWNTLKSGWHHIVLARASTTSNNLYIDGIAYNIAGTITIPSVSASFRAGGTFGGTGLANLFFHAGIGYTAQQIQRLYFGTMVSNTPYPTSSTLSTDGVNISWQPWSKQSCSPTCSAAADTGFSYDIYRFSEPTRTDIRTRTPWAIQHGPYATLPSALTGASATAMPLDPLATDSSGNALCSSSSGTTPMCVKVASIAGSACNASTPSGCTFTDQASLNNGFSSNAIYNYIMVMSDAEGNQRVPQVQRYRSPYVAGDFSSTATAAFRTEQRWRRASVFLVDEVMQQNGTLQTNSQIMVHVPMDTSGLDHDFFIHKYEASLSTGSVTNNSPTGGYYPLQAVAGSSTWVNNAASCQDLLQRTGSYDVTACGDGSSVNSSNALLQSKQGTAPRVSVDQGALWKACANTGISDGSGNVYYERLPTDSEWMKAADWGDVAQQGTVTSTQFAGALGYGVGALESTALSLTGDISGTTISNIASTTGIEVGAFIVSTSYLNAGTTVASVVNATTITISQNSAANGPSRPITVQTLGNCNTNNLLALASAVSTTANCRSRYGAADMVGNVWEWTSGQEYTTAGFDNGVDGLWTGRTLNATNNLSFGTIYDLLRGFARSSGNGATVSNNGDFQWYASTLRGAFRGGNWGLGSQSGRWSLRVSHAPSAVYTDIGGRCSR